MTRRSGEGMIMVTGGKAMHLKHNHRRRGMTLVEMLIALFIMGMTIAVISQALVLCLKMAGASRSENTAETQAAFALEQIEHYMRDAMYVEKYSNDGIIFVLPERETNGYYRMIDNTQGDFLPFNGLVPDQRIKIYFMGGSVYVEDADTNVELAKAGGGDLTNLTFTYDDGSPVTNPLAIRRVNVSVTAQAGLGGHTRDVTVNTSIDIRNHR